MINILISDPYLERVSAELLEKTALTVLAEEQVDPESDLTIAVDDDARLQALNNEYLGIEAPTDVLSFPAGEDEVDPETGHPYLGDIILSYPRALEQSAVAGHGIDDEIQLLVIHGVLHLLGYDHAEEEEKEEMWAVQGDLLALLGVKINRLPE